MTELLMFVCLIYGAAIVAVALFLRICGHAPIPEEEP